MGVNSELVAYCDDKDGLRKVPSGLSKDLEKYLGFPVSSIPDPFGCHESFGKHMSSLLLESLDQMWNRIPLLQRQRSLRKRHNPPRSPHHTGECPESRRNRQRRSWARNATLKGSLSSPSAQLRTHLHNQSLQVRAKNRQDPLQMRGLGNPWQTNRGLRAMKAKQT